MYFIAGFGVLLTLLSTIMMVNPQYWANAIVSFSQKSYFHWFEVMTACAFHPMDDPMVDDLPPLPRALTPNPAAEITFLPPW